VAADSTSTFPEGASKLPRVGYMRSLSTEGVMALRPQVVLASADAGPPAALAQLTTAGVKVARLSAEHSPEGLRANVKAVAAALQLPDRGAQLAARIAAEWSATTGILDQLPGRPRVLFVLAHTGTGAMVSGDGTAADAMIRLARATNAATGFSGYKPLTAEAAIGAAPEVILVTREGLEQIGGVDALLARPGLALTPAGKARRVVALDALYLLGFGPRLPEAVRDLAAKARAP
jgi:iron complex transport system substrate-binding protein